MHTVDVFESVVCFLLLGSALRIALRLVYGPRGPAASDLCFFVLHLMSRLLLVLAFGGALLLFFGERGYIMWALAVFVLIQVLVMLVDRRQRMLLSVLAASIEAGVPLPASLAAMADEQLGLAARKTERLVARLNRGEPLSVAIERSGTALPLSTTSYAAVGELLDALPAAFRRNLADERRRSEIAATIQARTIYLIMLLAVLTGVVTFCMIKIVPAFQHIFADFGMELPLVTLWLVQISNALQSLSVLVVPVLLLVAFLIFSEVGRRLGWLKEIPLLSRASVGHQRSTVLGALALAAQSGRPFPPVLRILGDRFPLGRIARRLRAAAAEVEAGDFIWRSLLDHKLIGKTECAVLESAERAGNLPWALEEMSGHAARREALRTQAILDTVFPIVVLGVALLVAFYAIGLFYPIITLTSELI